MSEEVESSNSKSDHSEQTALEELQTLLKEYGSDGSMPSSGEFFSYFGLGNFRRTYLKQEKDWEGFNLQQTAFCERMFILANDFDSLMTLIHKIEWLTKQWREQRLTENDWAAYVPGDVHLFHAEIRSIFDSVARGALILAGNKVGQISSDVGEYSFNKLREFCTKKKERSTSIFGEELTQLISDLEWFLDARYMRDSFVHWEKDIRLGYIPAKGLIAFKTIFGTTDKPIYRGPRQFALSDGYILLQPYLGYYFGRLWCFLNAFTKFAGERIELQKGGFSWVPPRLEPAMRCIELATEWLQK